jgi:hypothetical protein
MDGHKPVGIVDEADMFMESRRVAAPAFHRRDGLGSHVDPLSYLHRKANQAVDPAAASPWLRIRPRKLAAMRPPQNGRPA